MAGKNQDANMGKITLDRKILVSIINLAAKEINGVESVTNSAFLRYFLFSIGFV